MTPDQLARFRTWGADQRGWRPATRAAYSTRVDRADRWCQAYADRPLARARLNDLRGFTSTIGPAASTRNTMRNALVAYYAWLQEQGRRKDNPALELPRLRGGRRLPRALSRADVHQLLTVAGAQQAQWRVAIGLLSYTGMRASEVCQIRWSDISEGWIRVDGKGGHQRSIPVHAELAELLEWWRQACTSTEWVLPGRDGPMAYQSLWYAVREVADSSGVEAHPHLLRSTFATTLLEEGADVATVQQLLGHASLATTSKYLAVRDGAAKSAVARLGWS